MSYDGWRLKPRLRAFSEGHKARLRGLQMCTNETPGRQRAVQRATAGFVAERSEALQAQFQPPAPRNSCDEALRSAARAGGLCGVAHRRGFSRQPSRSRRWWLPLLLLAVLASVALAACNQGDPPALGKPVAVTLRAKSDSAALGQATLTP